LGFDLSNVNRLFAARHNVPLAARIRSRVTFAAKDVTDGTPTDLFHERSWLADEIGHRVVRREAGRDNGKNDKFGWKMSNRLIAPNLYHVTPLELGLGARRRFATLPNQTLNLTAPDQECLFVRHVVLLCDQGFDVKPAADHGSVWPVSLHAAHFQNERIGCL
jgi:hypothetical protein